MNNNKVAVLAAFMGACIEEWEWKSEADHCHVQHAIRACCGTLFCVCVFVAHGLVSRVQLAPRPVLREREDHWSARLKK